MTLPAPHISEADAMHAFSQAMAEYGLRTDERLVADGELHRFTIDGDGRNSKNGWYVLHLDGLPAGEFGCWKRGINATWCAKKQTELTTAEWSEVTARIERARAERAERERMRHEATATEAARIWNEATPVDGQGHPYLARKGVNSHGLRVGMWPNGTQALLVPVQDAQGKIASLQAIFANASPTIGRDKDFLAGGKKRGCFYMVGQPPAGGAGTVVLCEGYATGASIHEATGLCVIVAFDAGNLKPAAHELRRRWPACEIVVAADNDRWTVPTDENPHIVENPGVTAARAVVEAMPARTRIALPEFTSLDGKPTDFNDLAKLDGLAAVRQQIMAVIPQPEAPANDNAPAVPMDGLVAPFGFTHVSDKGQPLSTVENLKYLLREYGITARYNVISKEVEIIIPGARFSRDNHMACSLTAINSLCARNRMPRGDVMEYILAIADENEYNPAAEWIDQAPWDGVDRITQLAMTLDPAEPEMAVTLLRRWMIGAVAAVFKHDGMSMQGVLVLQGAQNAGKTTWFWSLTNNNKRLAKEGVSLNPGDRDSVKGAISYWLVELGELDATFRKADIAALKSFITKDTDELFLRYSRASSTFPRRTAFLGTVNPAQYLHDDTGNRRYWTIKCGDRMSAMHGIDMQQAWAQAKALWESGEQHRLTRDEMERLNDANVAHTEANPIEELILTRFDWAGPRTQMMTATDVLLHIGYDRPNNKQAKDAGAILRRLTGGEPRKSNGKLCFHMPAKQSGIPPDDGSPWGPL